MSDPITPAPAPKFALGPLLIALLIGGLIGFFVGQGIASNGSSEVAPPPAVETTQPTSEPAPEPSESSTPTPTAKALLPAEEELSRQLGGIEVVTFRSEAPGVPVPPTQANRVSAEYAPGITADSICAPFETADGWLSLAVTTNNEVDGLVGVLNGC